MLCSVVSSLCIAILLIVCLCFSCNRGESYTGAAKGKNNTEDEFDHQTQAEPSQADKPEQSTFGGKEGEVEMETV